MGKAARLFNGDAEQTLYSRVTPSAEQREFLQIQWKALADHLQAELSSIGYAISTWLQGSYKYGTLIRPVRPTEEYDVDVGVYFEWRAKRSEVEPTPQQLRTWVHRSLMTYKMGRPAVKSIAEPKERCSRVIYVKRFHVDTPVYHLDSYSGRRRLATLKGNWEESDPKALYKWFKNVVDGAERDQLRRLIRYLKAWAAIAFDGAEQSRPSSIVLTVLVAKIYKGMWFQRLDTLEDDDALREVVTRMHATLENDSHIPNPVDASESLNRIPADAWPAFLTRLTALKECAESAEAAQDDAAAALAWGQAFSFLMPLPEMHGLEIVEGESTRAIMQIPEVQIEVADDRSFKQVTATYLNEVPSVPKGKSLRFKIVNASVIPAFAQVEWTVRNEGSDAAYLGDLGHTRGAINLFSVVERTRYAGKQYMDLLVRVNGMVYAARRIAVTIEDVPTRAAPTTRAWVTLRSRRGRPR